MIKNKIIRRAALFLSLILLLTSTVHTTYGLIVTKTDSLFNTFVPFESVVSKLLINKTVQHPLGDEYVIPEDVSFDFKIDFGSLYANTTIETTAGDVLADENGAIFVSVKPGKTFCAEGIDAGTKVTVTEIQRDGSGFAVMNGAAVMEGIVSEDGSLEFAYINVYTPESVQPVNVSVSGVKVLEGRDWCEGDSFSFTLEKREADGSWAALSTKTVTYDASNANFSRFDFSDAIHGLSFDEVGVYHFRMTEVQGDLENMDYDASVNTFTVAVTDADMDGKLEISQVSAKQNAVATQDNGNFSVFVTFNNTFVPAVPEPDDIELKLKVDKTVNNTGDLSVGPEDFEFVLENIVTGEKQTRITNTDGNAFFALAYTAEDVGKTFTYRLSETDLGLPGMSYDSRVYTISVAVALSEDNELAATVLINGQVSETLSMEFVNTYNRSSTGSDPTGDSMNVPFWSAMMLVSGCMTVCLIISDRRYRTREKKK